MERNDMELLRDYAANQSEHAFTAIVERHINMVYATALRQVQEPQLAQDVAQSVFIDLAKKARDISQQTILAGWLFRATRFAATKAMRQEARRKHWETAAAQSNSDAGDAESAWEQIAPLLNDCLIELPEADRSAVVLRFFEKKSIQEVGNALGTSESATKMRLSRALEELRDLFRKRGVVLPAALLAGALSVPSASAAPAGLASTIVQSVLLKQTALLTKGTLLLMTTKQKIALAAAIVLLLGGGTGLLLSRQGTSTNSVAAKPVEAELVFQNESEPPAEMAQGELKEAKSRVRLELRHTLKETNVMFVTNGAASGDGEMILVGDSGTVRLTPGTRAVRVRRSSGSGVGAGAGEPGPTPPPEYREVK
jgi:RNA polymerase sigma factor (sigma-70 family)